jgi:uncharacterized protein
MRYTKEKSKIHLILEPGDEIMKSLLELAKKEKIPSATLTGIGAIGNATLGYFDVNKKEYLKQTFPGSWELVSCVGSISWDGENPIAHVHVSISGADFELRAGHLFSGEITVTGEIFLNLNEKKLNRKIDPRFGLKLLALE